MEEKTVWKRNGAYAQILFYGLRPKNLLAQSSFSLPAKEVHEKTGELFFYWFCAEIRNTGSLCKIAEWPGIRLFKEAI